MGCPELLASKHAFLGEPGIWWFVHVTGSREPLTQHHPLGALPSEASLFSPRPPHQGPALGAMCLQLHSLGLCSMCPFWTQMDSP